MRKLAAAVALLVVATQAFGGTLDATWVAPTTNTDGTAIVGSLTYRVYWVLFPQTPCPGTQFNVTNPDQTTWTIIGLTQGMTYNVAATAVDMNGTESACSNMASAAARPDASSLPQGVSGVLLAFAPDPIPPSQPITMGQTTIFSQPNSGDAGLLVAYQVTLAQPGTLQTLSFYVLSAAGQLRLGVYDASGPGGKPGNKVAETAEFTPVTGWNTQPVVSPVALTPGTYWLAYLDNNDALSYPTDFVNGNAWYYHVTYGPMPAVFSSTLPSSGSFRWSFYGTLQ